MYLRRHPPGLGSLGVGCGPTKCMMKEFERYFESRVDIPLMRHGTRRRIEALINEQAPLFAKYLRDERNIWVPRIAS